MQSHKGAGLASIFAQVPETVPYEWFDEYFELMDGYFDANNGMIGFNKPKNGDLDQVGGTFHYLFVYEYFRRPSPYPEQRIDAILSLQHSNGSWERENNFWWLTMDAVYMLCRAVYRTGHRRDDVRAALQKTMECCWLRMNDAELRKKDFEGVVHTLVGAITCFAEVQMFLGRQEVYSDDPLFNILDKRPFI